MVDRTGTAEGGSHRTVLRAESVLRPSSFFILPSILPSLRPVCSSQIHPPNALSFLRFSFGFVFLSPCLPIMAASAVALLQGCPLDSRLLWVTRRLRRPLQITSRSSRERLGGSEHTKVRQHDRRTLPFHSIHPSILSNSWGGMESFCC